jgi:hypothetical protein
MSDWASEAKALGLRTKFYYTVRELSNHAAELWALRSLGTSRHGSLLERLALLHNSE